MALTSCSKESDIIDKCAVVWQSRLAPSLYKYQIPSYKICTGAWLITAPLHTREENNKCSWIFQCRGRSATLLITDRYVRARHARTTRLVFHAQNALLFLYNCCALPNRFWILSIDCNFHSTENVARLLASWFVTFFPYPSRNRSVCIRAKIWVRE